MAADKFGVTQTALDLASGPRRPGPRRVRPSFVHLLGVGP